MHFQSTHPHGVRLGFAHNNCNGRCVFQSTHPHGVRRFVCEQARALPAFNPRTRTGCDWISSKWREWRELFQSTHPHGVRPEDDVERFLRDPAFNPRTRTGCDLGADERVPTTITFNPRTRTGCDGFERSASSILTAFNPRTRTGCDDDAAEEAEVMELSIHAPARGATASSRSFRAINCSFQSTHPHGVRPCTGCRCGSSSLGFQSTHPHGVRPNEQIAETEKHLFQSTHPHGVRPARGSRTCRRFQFFQSTHPHGVRQPERYRDVVHKVLSIHAPARGATPNRPRS